MAHPLIILVLIGMVFKIISEIFLGMICLIRVLPRAATATEFREYIHGGTTEYIPRRE